MQPSSIDKLSGTWLSSYQYESSSRPGLHTSEHNVRLRRQGSQLVLESIPEAGKRSYLFVRIMLNDEGTVATGSWEEATDPEGHYHGAVYYGAIQVIVDADQQHMSGKWVGFGKNQEVRTGPWEFTRQ